MLQNEVLVATEAAKSSQRADLENHIKTAQNALEEKNNELSKIKSLLEQVGKYLIESYLLVYLEP